MLLIKTIQTLLPVFAVIGLGYLLTERRFLTGGFLNELNRLVYWVCLPALILVSLDRARGLAGESLGIIGLYFGATFVVIALAFVMARVLRLERWKVGTFVQGSFRGNLAFIGIPILLYALRDLDEASVNRILAQAVFVFAPTMILYNLVSVIVLVGGHQGLGRTALPGTLKNLTTNPLILAGLSGLLLYLLPLDLPVVVGDTLQFIGRMAAPAALICVGGGMALTSMEGRYRSATYAACLKVFATPAVTYLLSLPFGLSDTSLLILMIFSATPTAVASYIMAKELHGDPAMASGAIVLSTLLSILSLSAVVMVF